MPFHRPRAEIDGARFGRLGMCAIVTSGLTITRAQDNLKSTPNREASASDGPKNTIFVLFHTLLSTSHHNSVALYYQTTPKLLSFSLYI